MAGFFRELATRALSPRGTVHPVSAAPYSPRAESELPDAEVWPGAALPEAPAAPAAPIDAARVPGDRVSSPASDNQKPSLGEDDVLFPSREPAAILGRIAAPGVEVTRGSAPQLAAAAREPMSPDARDAPAADTPAPVRSTASAPRPPHSVTPLRPAAIAARAPVAPTALRVESRADADTQPAPEVHIHIGRIELTAAAAPAQAAKPRKPATRKALSLDEYLQQRSRRAP